MSTYTKAKLIERIQGLAVFGVLSTFMCMDGFQVWDVFYFLSLAIWLLMPQPGTVLRKRNPGVSHQRLAY